MSIPLYPIKNPRFFPSSRPRPVVKRVGPPRPRVRCDPAGAVFQETLHELPQRDREATGATGEDDGPMIYRDIDIMYVDIP